MSITAPAHLDALLQGPADWAAQCVALEAQARAAWANDIVALEALLHSARNALNGKSYPTKTPETFDQMLGDIAAWSQGGEASSHVRKCGQARFKLNKGGAIGTHPAFRAIDAWVDHEESKQDIRAQLLLHALREVQGAFEEEKLRRAQIGFDDLLNRLGRA
ncbi:hypothetical protein OEZ81_25400, partial [Leclercia adecarboxylata]|nr:hypothetical protein [Leclercia adecarboxylata]